VGAATAALWYYGRWAIEAYYKLVKSAGLQLEQWQQQTAAALARRLLAASMACVVVWQLTRSTAPEAETVRTFLVRLSGRQMRRYRPYTEPALLAGLWVYITMLTAREHYDLAEIKRALDAVLAKATGPDSG
jgi:hypothetical protein